MTHQYEKYKDESAVNRLASWFYWHERTQNRSTGFWGNSLRNGYHEGFQNALRQYVIYDYWARPVSNYDKIVDTVLSLQDADGHFAPVPGGGGCWDYNAADILIKCGYKRQYRTEDIESALKRLLFAILANQNHDGGFCESKKHPPSLVLGLDELKFIFSGRNPYLWYYRLRTTLLSARAGARIIKTHWTKEGRLWDQSDLWDTWFRYLALAEIVTSSNVDHKLKKLISSFKRQ